MKKLYITIGIFFISLSLSAQYAADLKVYNCDPKDLKLTRSLIQSMMGDGIILKSYSVSKTSSAEAFGFFEDKKERMGMKKGLVMTTGGISGLSSRNTRGDMSNNVHPETGRSAGGNMTSGSEDLEKILGKGHKTFDACVIEFDVIPTADTLSFNYVFGSEEYDEFVGSEYNDVFAFLISGKGIDKQKNLAVVPGTDIPVSVNTINNGNYTSYSNRIKPSNPTYFLSNINGNVGIEYDGLTRLMEIRQPVVPYETYHIKLAIADVADNAYDSGVLIEGKSIVSYEKSYSVLFEKNSHEVENNYHHLLNALAAQYQSEYSGKIIITGHTDNEGNQEANQTLSCKRANEVFAYLKSKGIDESRMVVDCKGENMPEYDNFSEKGKQANRRVEIKILGENETYLRQKQESDLQITRETSSLIKNYPNPFVSNTEIEAFIKEDVKDAFVMITDMSGKAMRQIFLLERGKTSFTYDSQNLISGTYIATLVTDGQKTGSLKLIVQK